MKDSIEKLKEIITYLENNELDKEKQKGVESLIDMFFEKVIIAELEEDNDEEGEIMSFPVYEERIKRLVALVEDKESFLYENEYKYQRKREINIVKTDICINKSFLQSALNGREGQDEKKLYKHWCEGSIFEHDYYDENTESGDGYGYEGHIIQFDYFLPEDRGSINLLPVFGLDVEEDFTGWVPSLPEETLKNVWSLNQGKYWNQDVSPYGNRVFFVNKNAIYVLPYGSQSDLPKCIEFTTFEEFETYIADYSKEFGDALSISDNLKSFYSELPSIV